MHVTFSLTSTLGTVQLSIHQGGPWDNEMRRRQPLTSRSCQPPGIEREIVACHVNVVDAETEAQRCCRVQRRTQPAQALCTHMHAHSHARTHSHTHVHMHTLTRTHMCARAHARMHTVVPRAFSLSAAVASRAQVRHILPAWALGPQLTSSEHVA